MPTMEMPMTVMPMTVMQTMIVAIRNHVHPGGRTGLTGYGNGFAK
jgi:hypothetical protein